MNHCPKLKTIIWKIYARQEAACAFSCPADVPTTMRSRISACPTQKSGLCACLHLRDSPGPFLKAGYELLFYDVSRDLTPILMKGSWTASALSISAAITAFAATTGNLYGSAPNGASSLWRIRPTPSSQPTVLTLTVIMWWAACANGLEYRLADSLLRGKAAFPFPFCLLTKPTFPCAVCP